MSSKMRLLVLLVLLLQEIHVAFSITSGDLSGRGQLPHVVSYQWGLWGRYVHSCGGSIVSPTFVLTAANCIVTVPQRGNHRVVSGVLYLSEDVETRAETSVAERIVHPGHLGGAGPNDIALLRLETPLVFNDLTRAVQLPVEDPVEGSYGLIAGWGSISYTSSPSMPDLQMIHNLPVMPNTDCFNAVQVFVPEGTPNPYDLDSNFCSGPFDSQINACVGDNGGPFTQDGVLAGVISWMYWPCGYLGTPNIYTRVSRFLPWIRENVPDLNTNSKTV